MDMKIGAHCEIAGSGLAFDERFRLYKRSGADGVELVMGPGAYLNIGSTDADFLHMARLARDNGLAVSGMTAGYTWHLPMTSDDAGIRSAGKMALRRAIEGASMLGTDSLLVVPGYASTVFIVPSEEVEPELALHRAQEGIQEAVAYAAEMNVHLYVEEVWNGMLRSPEQMAMFLDSFQSEYVGAYFDTANVFPEGDPVHWIHVLGKRIGRVHMKDYSGSPGGMAGFGPTGEGDLNFPSILQALSQVGYDGWIGAEHHNCRTPEEAERTLHFLCWLIGREI